MSKTIVYIYKYVYIYCRVGDIQMVFKSNKQRRCVMAQLSKDSKSDTLNKKMKDMKEEKPKLRSLKKFNNVTIIGRRWFDRVNGNTYHVTDVYVDGKLIGSSDVEYGYGDQYIQTGHEILQKEGYYPKTNERLSSGMDKDYYDFQTDRRENRDKFVTSVADVSRKRDL